MANFLNDMDRFTSLEDRLAGRNGGGFDFFSTHPQTAGRVQAAQAEAAKYPSPAAAGQDNRYMNQIGGLLYGDNPDQGFVRGQSFYHPGLDVTFTVPDGFSLSNQSSQVVATGPNGAVLVFDGAANPKNLDPVAYLSQEWLKGEQTAAVEPVTIGGHPAATVTFGSPLNRAPADIRMIAVQWAPDRFYRFQVGYPRDAPPALLQGLQRTTSEVRSMTAAERQSIRPYRLEIVTAREGDSVAVLAARMAIKDHGEERFRALNGLNDHDAVVPGHLYKIIAE